MSKGKIEAIRTKATWSNIDWSNIPYKLVNMGGWSVDYRKMLTRSHVLCYVELTTREAARKFGCEFEEFYNLIKSENASFFLMLNGLFNYSNTTYEVNNETLESLFNLFKMPNPEGFSYNECLKNNEVTKEQLSEIFTTIIEQMIPENKQEEVKKHFNI